MINRLTFSNVIKILLENKKKTFPQYRMVYCIFSKCMNDTVTSADLIGDGMIQISRWCSGERPIPKDILEKYEENDYWNDMADDFRTKIIPNLINELQARSQMEALLDESIDVIGADKIQEMKNITDNAAFFAAMVRYTVLNDHSQNVVYSPDLSETLLAGRVPSCTKDFLGRKKELSEVATALKNNPLLFITGIAGIGKSEFAKHFAKKNEKKYTNMIYLYYTGSLKKCIAELEFASDTSEMTEAELFESHYKILQTLYPDSLIIIDNFNILPKDDAFFREFIKNRFQILVTTRCKPNAYHMLEIKELNREKELCELFYRQCPSSKTEPEFVSEIIDLLNAHTLTVSLAALTLEASGMDIEEFLCELKTTGIRTDISEEVELYKDETFSYGRMMEHLRKLLQLSRLSEEQQDVLRNLCLLPASGVRKASFKQWLQLESLNAVNHLIQYGFITEDTENKKISLHPLIQEIAFEETFPTMSACSKLMNSLHFICLVHGLEVRRPEMVVQSLMSVIERIIVDAPEEYLLFLQDAFPYFEKYLVTDYLPKLVERIAFIMEQHQLNTPRDKALLLDYKAELFVFRKEYSNALKKRLKAIQIIKSANTEDVRVITLYSNLYNNLSNTYLYLKKMKEAAEALKKAFKIRKKYEHLGLMEAHDTLQQMANLANMLIIGNEFAQARELLNLYESLISEYENQECLDYGFCQTMFGILCYREGKATEAERHLLSAETIIADAMGTDNDYMKTVYRYLHSLYTRWRKLELAQKYKEKYLEANKNKLKIAP